MRERDEAMTARPDGDMRRLRNVLRTIARQAQHASLTGALDGGQARCVGQYNHIVGALFSEGLLDDSVYRAAFAPLPEDTDYDGIGVSAGLLQMCLDSVEEDVEEGVAHPHRSAHHILRAVGKMAERSSLTGHLSGGRPRLVALHNAVESSLVAAGALPSGLFDPLDDDDGTMGEVAVAALHLAAYVEDACEEGEPQLPDVPRVGLELHDIGDLVREAMPQWMRAEVETRAETVREEVREEVRGVVADIHAGRLTDPDEIARLIGAIQQPRVPSPPTPPTPATPATPPTPPVPPSPPKP
jgi:hypothetical protein